MKSEATVRTVVIWGGSSLSPIGAAEALRSLGTAVEVFESAGDAAGAVLKAGLERAVLLLDVPHLEAQGLDLGILPGDLGELCSLLLIDSGDIEGAAERLGAASVLSPDASLEEVLLAVQDLQFADSSARRYPRRNVALSVEVAGVPGERPSVLHASNISVGGIYLRTLRPYPAGCSLVLRVVLDGVELELDGEVVYSIGVRIEDGLLSHALAPERPVFGHPGNGVRFVDVQDVQRARLEAFTRSG